jgi:hypothetical protein
MRYDKIKRIGSKAEVWNGNAKQTSGGLKKKDLVRVKKDNKYRIKSKKQQAMGKNPNAKSQKGRSKWTKAIIKARKELIKDGVFKKDDFVPIIKRTSSKLTAKSNRLGKLLYKRAKDIND